MSKYKSHRPEERWECNRGLASKLPGAKRPTQRLSRPKKNQSMGNMNTNSDILFPPSDMYFPPSEAHHPQSEAFGAVEGVSPSDTTGTALQHDLQVQWMQLPTKQSQSTRPAKRLNAMTSDAASAALRRAIQSSPARWAGTQHSPIEVDDELGSTRRLLFPSPRKDGSPKVLWGVQPNVVQIAADVPSPKEQALLATNKENCPPAIDADDADAELLALFEEEMERPTTPVQKSPAPNAFKTPTRPTPNHRPITRSVSKSIRSARSAKSPGQPLTFDQRTPIKTPSSFARRRSPRNHQGVFESPFTATINQLMSEANNHMSPSRQCNMELDFGNLPDLPMMDNAMHNSSHTDVNFNLDDFFSTDIPMPSSPPRMFHLYEDPAAMANVNWSEFGHFDDQLLLHHDTNMGNQEVEIKEEPSDESEGFMEAPTQTKVPQQLEQATEQAGQPPAVPSAEQKAETPKEKSTEEHTKEPVEASTEDHNEEEDVVDMVGVERTS